VEQSVRRVPWTCEAAHCLNEPPKRLRTDYRIGLSAWTDKSLLEEGHFYPYKTMTAEEQLWWYARYFDVVEVNNSFYAILSFAKTSPAWQVIDFLDPILLYRRWQLVDRNPVFAVDWPRAAPYHARIPTRVERQRLLAAAEPCLRPLILIGMYTGLRKGSILRLAPENYRTEPGILHVLQKGGRELKLPMTPPLTKVLDGLGIAVGPLFRWPDGRIMHRFRRKAWARACVKAGLYVEKPDPKHPRTPRKVPAMRFHDLRHCMGTVLAEAGVEQRLIQELLGHSGIRISERYTRPRRPALRRAALKATRLMGVEPLPPA
jgi:integrase